MMPKATWEFILMCCAIILGCQAFGEFLWLYVR